MAGMETKNYQPVCVLNLEKLGLLKDCKRGATVIGGAPLLPFNFEHC
jgi:hypothetical protein